MKLHNLTAREFIQQEAEMDRMILDANAKKHLWYIIPLCLFICITIYGIPAAIGIFALWFYCARQATKRNVERYKQIIRLNNYELTQVLDAHYHKIPYLSSKELLDTMNEMLAKTNEMVDKGEITAEQREAIMIPYKLHAQNALEYNRKYFNNETCVEEVPLVKEWWGLRLTPEMLDSKNHVDLYLFRMEMIKYESFTKDMYAQLLKDCERERKTMCLPDDFENIAKIMRHPKEKREFQKYMINKKIEEHRKLEREYLAAGWGGKSMKETYKILDLEKQLRKINKEEREENK